jgi:hypothetical protein
MVICDLVWRDPGTGKATLLGCFSAVTAAKFPASIFSLGLYLALTDGRGKIPIRIRIVDADESREPVFESVAEFDFTDPRVIAEICLNMTGLTFPEPGEYRCQAFAGNEFLIERRILVIQAGENPDAPGEGEGNEGADQ